MSSFAVQTCEGQPAPPQRAKVVGSAVVLLVSAAIIATLSPYLYLTLFANAYFAAALLSILVIQTWIRESWKESLYIAAGGLAIVAYQWAGFRLVPHLVQTISIIGFCGFIALALQAIWAKGERRNASRAGLVGASFLLLLYFFSGPFLLRTTRNHPQVLDLYLYSFDASLHVQLSFVLGALLRKWPALNAVAGVFYIGLPVSLTLAFAGLIVSRVKRGLEAIFSFCFGGPLAILCYGLFPAIGPRALFQASFPLHPFQTQQVARLVVEPLTIHSLVNAMPSLHMTWALLAFWYSRGLPWFARGITTAFLLFTVVSTMGMGEHYFVDLVVAFPFALFLESACSFSVRLGNKQRLCGICLGGVGTITWFLVLRFATRLFWLSPLVPWLLVVGTVSAILLAHTKLQAALDLLPDATTAVIVPSPVSQTALAFAAGSGRVCEGENLVAASAQGPVSSRG